jgi:hypothetical protein
MPSYCSGDGSRIALVNNYDSASSFTVSFLIDRVRDASGAPAGDGVAWLSLNVVGSYNYMQLMWSSGVGALALGTSGAGAPMFPGARVSSAAGLGGGLTSLSGNVALMPMIVMLGQMRYLLAGMLYNPTDIAANVTVTVNNLGANHTYLTLPGAFYQGYLTSQVDNFALLWE